MPDNFDLILTGGQVATPNGLESCDIGVTGGRIAALGALGSAAAAERFDAAGLTILPGVIDTQVHFREPGLEHKEDLATGSAGAAMGGVTAFFEMPNTNPNTIDEAALNDKLRRAAGRAWVDHAFFIGATDENADKLDQLELLPGCAGVKVFMGSSTGSCWSRTMTRWKRCCATAAAASPSIPRTSRACASAWRWCATAPIHPCIRCGATRRSRSAPPRG